MRFTSPVTSIRQEPVIRKAAPTPPVMERLKKVEYMHGALSDPERALVIHKAAGDPDLIHGAHAEAIKMRGDWGILKGAGKTAAESLREAIAKDDNSSFAVTEGIGPTLAPPPANVPEAAGWAQSPGGGFPANVPTTTLASVPADYRGTIDDVRGQRPVSQFADAGGIVRFDLSPGSGASTVEINCVAVASALGANVQAVVAAITKAISAKAKR